MFCCLTRDHASTAAPGALALVARACSPRVEIFDETAVFDASGLARVIGPPAEIAREVSRLATSEGVIVRVAVARTVTAAWLLAHARPGCTVAMTEPADAVRALPLGWLSTLATSSGPRPRAQGPRKSGPQGRAKNFRHAPGPDAMQPATDASLGPVALGLGPAEDVADALATFARWGLRTMGDLAGLPAADVLTRLGPVGARLHTAACGVDLAPLVPSEEPRRFVERIELEWPIEELEPLSFVLARLCDALSVALEHADRGAVGLTTRLGLVTRAVHERTLTIPAPMRDARVLRTLILLDLESHPPPAGIDVVELALDVTPGRIEQGSLLARPLPSPENLATLLARLGALMGETRLGAPVLVDTYDERVVAMTKFETGPRPKAQGPSSSRDSQAASPEPQAPSPKPKLVMRRMRLPIAARVEVEHGAPVRLAVSARDLPGGRIVTRAGPWRSSGRWWSLDQARWDRDEWDVEVASKHVYRLARDRATGAWTVDGVYD